MTMVDSFKPVYLSDRARIVFPTPVICYTSKLPPKDLTIVGSKCVVAAFWVPWHRPDGFSLLELVRSKSNHSPSAQHGPGEDLLGDGQPPSGHAADADGGHVDGHPPGPCDGLQ